MSAFMGRALASPPDDAPSVYDDPSACAERLEAAGIGGFFAEVFGQCAAEGWSEAACLAAMRDVRWFVTPMLESEA